MTGANILKKHKIHLKKALPIKKPTKEVLEYIEALKKGRKTLKRKLKQSSK